MTLSKHTEHLSELYQNIDLVEQEYSPDEESERTIRGKMYTLVRKVAERFQIGIVTATPKEFAAVTAMLNNLKDYPVPGDPNTYCVGTVPSRSDGRNSENHIVATVSPKTGNNTATGVAANLLRSFPNVRDVLMVGIAGGIPNPKNPEKHTRVGDVVVSQYRGVVQYDMRRIDTEGIEIRDTSAPPSARMISLVNLLEAKRLAGEYPWEHHILRACHLEGATRPEEACDVLYDPHDPDMMIEHPKDPTRRKGQPKIHYGLIGSANILLRNPKLRDQLRDKYGVLAIEMEGSGIADGTWIHGAQYMLLRGICDYCDEHKSDLWQPYAAVAAAAYARALLELLPSHL